MAEGVNGIEYEGLYARFQAPVAALDCGKRCAPHNERGVPFCCDTLHAVPTAYQAEWAYLNSNTDLWHLWEADGSPQGARHHAQLRAQAPEGQVLIECQGHALCQREFRSVTCRAFPFFPYLTREGAFIGLSYYWEYEDRCWVISNLRVVTPEYRSQFVAAYDELFARVPEERENFRHYSVVMRRVFGRQRRAVPLLHRNGRAYKITPRNGRMRRVPVERFPAFGPYEVAADMPFPDELEEG
jgi:hypothetical protein